MNVKQLREMQPEIFKRFEEMLGCKQLSHAYLFVGALGSFEMALFLSQSLFCENPQSGTPCQVCRACRLIEERGFADVRLISPQGNSIKKETIREMVSQFSQSGFESNKQVFIIREAEKMNAHAANALLKGMEEPDSEIVLFLLTNQEELVLPTIKSRSQLVYFPARPAYVQQRLEQKGILKKQARMIAQLTESLELAEELASQSSFLDLIQVSQHFVESLLSQPRRAYLQVPYLVGRVSEKIEQDRLLRLLTLQASTYLMDSEGRKLLGQLLEARNMWQNNVSLQNALEYMVLERLA